MYKHKYPKLKESEIVSKVQKEWDMTDEIEKRNLQKMYEDKNYLADGGDVTPVAKKDQKVDKEPDSQMRIVEPPLEESIKNYSESDKAE